MKRTSEKDFWFVMSLMEISKQAEFAIICYDNIELKTVTGNDAIFSSIHSFFSHCGMVSKLLMSQEVTYPKFTKFLPYCLRKCFKYKTKTQKIGQVLGISKGSLIHKREFRNSLEHYDERLKEWIKEKGLNANIGINNIGRKSTLAIPGMVYVTHFDPQTFIFTLVNEDFDMTVLYKEVVRIKEIAENWEMEILRGIKKPPFI
jgi:hypothetical protein